MRDALKFFTGFLKNPLSVGSVVPSSRSLSEALIEGEAFQNAHSVVEVGPGTGAITEVILSRMRDRSAYLGLDLDLGFVQALSRKYLGARFVCDSVEHLASCLKAENHTPADFVVSGLPWTLLPEELQSKFLDAILDSMKPNGMMVTFVYVHMLVTPQAKRFVNTLSRKFQSVSKSSVIWANVPPAVVFRCRR